ncbi:substrate-binding periplasmic protein [Pseudodesulfovibrio piezophilus]|nr:transporter substrate-binding domain-containing protein [Pseudodesulfovibrio piezophilus]
MVFIRFYFFFVISAFALLFSTASAGEIRAVISTSPAWESFTNRDGTGLYHEILREVFNLYDVPVRHIYSKSIRSIALLESGQADVMTCSGTETPALVTARYPLYQSMFYVFFKKKRIGTWHGLETLWGKEILSQATYYTEKDFPVPVRIKMVIDGIQALGMILMDRSDFYVDDMILIKQSMAGTMIPFAMNDYAIEPAGTRSYYPLFSNSDRGRTLCSMFEEGLLRLHRTGKLKPIFDRWFREYPDYDGLSGSVHSGH